MLKLELMLPDDNGEFGRLRRELDELEQVGTGGAWCPHPPNCTVPTLVLALHPTTPVVQAGSLVLVHIYKALDITYIATLSSYRTAVSSPQEADHFCDLYEGERKAVAAAVKGYRLALGEQLRSPPCSSIITTAQHCMRYCTSRPCTALLPAPSHISSSAVVGLGLDATMLVRPHCAGPRWHPPRCPAAGVTDTVPANAPACVAHCPARCNTPCRGGVGDRAGAGSHAGHHGHRTGPTGAGPGRCRSGGRGRLGCGARGWAARARPGGREGVLLLLHNASATVERQWCTLACRSRVRGGSSMCAVIRKCLAMAMRLRGSMLRCWFCVLGICGGSRG